VDSLDLLVSHWDMGSRLRAHSFCVAVIIRCVSRVGIGIKHGNLLSLSAASTDTSRALGRMWLTGAEVILPHYPIIALRVASVRVESQSVRLANWFGLTHAVQYGYGD
jgi:hypothetical protein